MSTSFNVFVDKFLRKIEKDEDFFSYYNITVTEAMQLAREQALGYLYEAIEKLMEGDSPDVDFFDYTEDLQIFNFNVTKKEIGLITDLMREVYFERDFATLKAFKIRMTPTDLNQFSPSAERRTYVDMVLTIKNENEIAISNYKSVDRLTGKSKTIDYSQYYL